MTELQYTRFLKKVDSILDAYARYMSLEYKKVTHAVDGYNVKYFFDSLGTAISFDYVNGAYVLSYDYLRIPFVNLRIRKPSSTKGINFRFGRYTSYRILIENMHRHIVNTLGLHYPHENSLEVSEKIMELSGLEKIKGCPKDGC